ncbi:MAG: hypothetical protein KBS35_00960 [Mycoplasma sp.]|nr:hypothetical protein [Candidatus Hennigella equi]
MKKLLTGLISLTSLAGVTTPLAFMTSCGNTPSSKFVDVTVVDTTEPVTLEKTKAEKGKQFETHVTYTGSFSIEQVIVKVGKTVLKEGDEKGFSYNYMTDDLTIYEGVVFDKVEISFQFHYVVYSNIRAEWQFHEQWMVSDIALNASDISKDITLILNVSYANWQLDESYPYPVNYHIYYDEKQPSAEIKEVMLLTSLGSSISEVTKDSDNSGFTLAGTINDATQCLIAVVCRLPKANTDYRVWGYNSK